MKLLVTSLMMGINDVVNRKDYSMRYGTKPIDETIYKILINNGCLINNEGRDIYYNITYGDKYFNFILVYGMLGNDVNKFFDIIQMSSGDLALVIFLDYFKGIDTKPVEKIEDGEDALIEDKDGNLKLRDNICGNSDYIYALKKIFEIYLDASYPVKFTDERYLACSIYTKYRYVPTVIACAIISKFRMIEEFEVDGLGLDYKFIKKELENGALYDIINGIFS